MWIAQYLMGYCSFFAAVSNVFVRLSFLSFFCSFFVSFVLPLDGYQDEFESVSAIKISTVDEARSEWLS